MPSIVARRPDVSSNANVHLERHHATELAARGLVRLCAAGFVAYCSYAICRTPLLPLFALDLGAGPSLIGFVMSRATDLWALVAAVIAHSAGVATTTAATSAYITDVTRRARYGAAHGVFGTIYDVGDALGPPQASWWPRSGTHACFRSWRSSA